MESFLHYSKCKNDKLHSDFKKLGIENSQNYVPIYKLFFDLNEQNFNSINLSYSNNIKSINNLNSESDFLNTNLINCQTSNNENKDVFIKKAPLLDPYYFVMGKYKESIDDLIKLPSFSCDSKKLNDPFNSAYTDGFFSFLTNQLNEKFNIIHGTKFYGSYLGFSNFKINIIEDLDYLIKSNYFVKNQNVLFKIDDYQHLYSNIEKLNPITIGEDASNLLGDIVSIDNPNFDIQSKNSESDMQMDIELIDPEEIYNENIGDNEDINEDTSSRTTYSSRTSLTTLSENGSCESMNVSDEEESEVSEDWESIGSLSSSNEEVNITFDKFPIHYIMTEKCENTLDYLINNNMIEKDEWFAILLQIIFTLIIYQKCFHFTHNDLHTENVMYINTNEKFIYYHFNKKNYKVPTYGKIFKIIDFGRAIYKVKGKLIYSDEFKYGGNAYGQYNFEPFMNKNKPRLDPNYSFDLCRLGCCIFDYLVEDIEDLPDLLKKNPVVNLIDSWCRDDNNVLINYKQSGKERYSGFKYYKMISLKVHKHLPILQLQKKEFSKFETKKIPNNCNIMNIDNLPVLV